MKGKHGAAAQTRRDAAEATARAERAERERDKLAAEIAAIQDDSAAAVEALRSQLRAALAERDQAEGPKVADLNQENARLNEQVASLQAEIKSLDKKFHRATDRLIAYHAAQPGVTGTEAIELTVADVTGEAPPVVQWDKGAQSTEAQVVMDFARGYRGAGTVARMGDGEP